VPSIIIRGLAVMTEPADRRHWRQIEDGAVLQRDGVIVEIGPFAELTDETLTFYRLPRQRHSISRPGWRRTALSRIRGATARIQDRPWLRAGVRVGQANL
jgi:hypothetical protein